MTSHKKGFIALFFTLGASSLLMVFVAVSSASVFDFVHSREYFKETRTSIEEVLHCADMYTNTLIQLYELPHVFDDCTVTDQVLVRINGDILEFSFTIKDLNSNGTITRGRITELTYSYISL